MLQKSHTLLWHHSNGELCNLMYFCESLLTRVTVRFLLVIEIDDVSCRSLNCGSHGHERRLVNGV